MHGCKLGGKPINTFIAGSQKNKPKKTQHVSFKSLYTHVNSPVLIGSTMKTNQTVDLETPSWIPMGA